MIAIDENNAMRIAAQILSKLFGICNINSAEDIEHVEHLLQLYPGQLSGEARTNISNSVSVRDSIIMDTDPRYLVSIKGVDEMLDVSIFNCTRSGSADIIERISLWLKKCYNTIDGITKKVKEAITTENVDLFINMTKTGAFNLTQSTWILRTIIKNGKHILLRRLVNHEVIGPTLDYLDMLCLAVKTDYIQIITCILEAKYASNKLSYGDLTTIIANIDSPTSVAIYDTLSSFIEHNYKKEVNSNKTDDVAKSSALNTDTAEPVLLVSGQNNANTVISVVSKTNTNGTKEGSITKIIKLRSKETKKQTILTVGHEAATTVTPKINKEVTYSDTYVNIYLTEVCSTLMENGNNINDEEIANIIIDINSKFKKNIDESLILNTITKINTKKEIDKETFKQKVLSILQAGISEESILTNIRHIVDVYFDKVNIIDITSIDTICANILNSEG